MRLAQKALSNLSASSFVCCSAGTTFLWTGIAQVGFTVIGFALFAAGLLLFLVAIILFILRSILLDQALRKRDIRLQGTVFLFTFLLFVLLGLFGRRIIQNSIPTLLTVQDQTYLGACLTATICLVFPLGMLLFALVSREITDTLSKDGSEEVSKQ